MREVMAGSQQGTPEGQQPCGEADVGPLSTPTGQPDSDLTITLQTSHSWEANIPAVSLPLPLPSTS